MGTARQSHKQCAEMNDFLMFDNRYALEPAFPEVFSPVSTAQLPDSRSWVVIRSMMLPELIVLFPLLLLFLISKRMRLRVD